VSNPIVTQVRPHSRVHSVQCPLTSTHYIPRDASAWKVHMVKFHSANELGWDPSGQHSEGSGGFRDLEGEEVYHWPDHKCYGCGATFLTAAALVAHLSSAHGAS